MVRNFFHNFVSNGMSAPAEGLYICRILICTEPCTYSAICTHDIPDLYLYLLMSFDLYPSPSQICNHNVHSLIFAHVISNMYPHFMSSDLIPSALLICTHHVNALTCTHAHLPSCLLTSQNTRRCFHDFIIEKPYSNLRFKFQPNFKVLKHIL